MLVDFFSHGNFLPAIFDFHFHENLHFRDKFQALIIIIIIIVIITVIIIIAFKGAIWNFLQSPQCAVNILQHVHASGQGATNHAQTSN